MSASSYVFDPQNLERIAQQHAAEFRHADPYPYIVMDDFLRPDAALELERAFPGPDDITWDRYGVQGLEVKLGCGDERAFPDAIRNAIYQFNSGPFIRFLEHLTGIDHLLPDPHLHGGGMHMTLSGGHLGIHADFNWHEMLQAHRRLNFLIYLTPDWQPDWGGELELWDTTGTQRRRRVEPLFNRAVLFTTRSDTFHGHPAPWSAPGDINRRSIAMYYYTNQRPAEEVRPPHNTLYKGHNA